MACCWMPDFRRPFERNKYFLESTGGWVDLHEMHDIPWFDGKPTWIAGNLGLSAVRSLTDALSQYVNHYLKYHHANGTEVFRYFYTQQQSEFGGMVPVAMFVVPDWYMKWYTPTWELKFQFQSAIDYTGNLNVSIPEQLKASPYYQQFLQERQFGFPRVPNNEKPESTSEQDIDIQFSFVRYRGLLMAGGRDRAVIDFLTTMAGAMRIDFGAETQPRQPDLAGLATPVIFHKVSDFLADEAAGFSDPVSYRAKNNRGHVPVESAAYDTILAGYNSLYPRSDKTEIYLRVNDVLVDVDFEKRVPLAPLYDAFHIRPVQEWSAPNDFQRSQDVTSDEQPA